MVARVRTFGALAGWAYLTWLVLTWTRTLEQFLVGAGVALLVAAFLTPLGPVPGMLAFARRIPRLAVLAGYVLGKIVWANLGLAVRIWAPARPLRPGMVVVATSRRTDADLAAVGLISSLIVDNQLVDLDRDRGELQYHAVDVDGPSPNSRLERLLP